MSAGSAPLTDPAAVPAPEPSEPRLTVKTVALYLLGNEGAIRELARYKPLPWVGAVLVLTAGIAREYDRKYLIAEPTVLLLPFAASIIAAMLIFACVETSNPSASESSTRRFGVNPRAFRLFLGLFWLTAPLAWLYAIPVERFLAPLAAAKSNLCLLALVAAWRVMLLSRVLGITYAVPVSRILPAVLLPSAGMVFAAGVLVPASLVPLMARISDLPPQTRLILDVSHSVTLLAVPVGIGALATIAMLRPRTTSVTLPGPNSGAFPAIGLTATVLIALAAALPSQIKTRRFHNVEKLFEANRYEEALAMLSSYERRDLPWTRTLPLSQYDDDDRYIRLPSLLLHIDADTAPWVRNVYWARIEFVLHHPPPWTTRSSGAGTRHRVQVLADYLRALSLTPEGQAWIRGHPTEIQAWLPEWEPGPAEQLSVDEVHQILRQLGAPIPESTNEQTAAEPVL